MSKDIDNDWPGWLFKYNHITGYRYLYSQDKCVKPERPPKWTADKNE